MSQPPFDLAAAHRWFAVEFNNLAWDLVENADRTPEQTEEMLHAAHAAWLHWSQVGSVLNRQRAECLLSTAYAAAGQTEPAVRYGRSCVTLSEQPDSEQTPFDQATAHACLARALSLAGETQEAAEHYRRASLAAEGLTDAGEREVYAQLYPQSE
jgi:hypothetical protein